MTIWAPISTAPEDGTGILVYDQSNEWQCEAWFDRSEGCFVFPDWARVHRSIDPTHWMPLPEPPK